MFVILKSKPIQTYLTSKWYDKQVVFSIRPHQIQKLIGESVVDYQVETGYRWLHLWPHTVPLTMYYYLVIRILKCFRSENDESSKESSVARLRLKNCVCYTYLLTTYIYIILKSLFLDFYYLQ